jgi:monofunctional glycosyltransferase
VARPRSLFKIVARAIGLAALALVCLFVGLIALYAYATPVSTLMLARKIEGKAYERLPVRLGDVAPALIASVIASEDSIGARSTRS